jgi:hypothetical protein
VIVTYIQRYWTSYNDRRNIGCKMNVVYEPPEDGLIYKTETYVWVDVLNSESYTMVTYLYHEVKRL